MLIYEHDRTIAIVKRLTALPVLIRPLALVTSSILTALLFTLISVFVLGQLWWVGAILGAVIGFATGLGISAITVIVIEWMAQMLVAQGEILAESKRSGTV